MKKRILSLVLALGICLCILPSVAFAADITVTEVIPCTLDYYLVGDFSEGLARVVSQGEGLSEYAGFIDKEGKEVIPFQYDEAKDFSEGLAAVAKDGKWGFIDKTGKEVIPCKYDQANDFSEGLAAVRIDSGEKSDVGRHIYKWGFIDKTGKEVIPFQYFDARDFSEGLAAVYTDSGERNLAGVSIYKWSFIDKTGTEVIPCKYDRVNAFSEGLAAVAIDHGEKNKYGVVRNPNYKWGFIDKTGREVVSIQYDNVKNFSEGLAAVCIDCKWGFIDKTGKEVVPLQYDLSHLSNGAAARFSDGPVAVWKDGKWGFLTIDGYTSTPSTTAYASTQTVMVDGQPVTFNAYALKDEKGNLTNYVKLRDVADVLNGSAAQFQVGWDGSIAITTNAAYTANGSEMVKNFDGDQVYTVNTSPVKVNGQTADLEAITLSDSTGGYTYFKLRDLGKALGFDVSWVDGKIVIDPNSPYSDAR